MVKVSPLFAGLTFFEKRGRGGGPPLVGYQAIFLTAAAVAFTLTAL